MIVDLNLRGKRVLIVGGGPETERKAWMFMDAGARVTVAAPAHAATLRDASSNGRVDLLAVDTSTDLVFVDRIEPPPDVVVVHTAADGPEEPEIAERARRRGSLVYVVDDVESSDFVQPALANSGFIQVAVSTGGKSPPMARILARRLADQVGEGDVRMVELLERARSAARRTIDDPEAVREVLYGLAEDLQLASMVEAGRMDEAWSAAEARIRKASGAD